MRDRPRDTVFADEVMSDEAFVEACYRMFLERACDPEGKKNGCIALKNGLSRLEYIKSIVSSNEYYGILTERILGKTHLPNLKKIKPDNYVITTNRFDQQDTVVFRAEGKDDYDWLETMIHEYGYYEKPGVWSLAIDDDKIILSDIIGKFRPSSCLEIGCSSGAVLKLLRDSGISAEGIEISHKALALSYPEVRNNIHFGDLLTLGLQAKYDMIIGMDIFEHLNPTKLFSYLRCCMGLLNDGGFLLANIPAFGRDPVFGELFPMYLADWKESSGMPFTLLGVDDKGWPLHGHLIWATASFWQHAFESAGFRRETDIEMTLHDMYDAHLSTYRRSFFVFSRHRKPNVVNGIVKNVMKRVKQF